MLTSGWTSSMGFLLVFYSIITTALRCTVFELWVWDRPTDGRRLDGRIAALVNAPYLRAGINNKKAVLLQR